MNATYEDRKLVEGLFTLLEQGCKVIFTDNKVEIHYNTDGVLNVYNSSISSDLWSYDNRFYGVVFNDLKREFLNKRM